ncbi:MAG: N-acetylmuramic acid 6-phosphate etherase [Gemmatimonadaceae bacterium]
MPRPSDPRVTERRNPRTAAIDIAPALEIVDLINQEDRTVADAVASQRVPIAAAIEAAEDAFRNGGRLLYFGAGTSGRLGILDAAECPPTFGTDPGMVVGVIAGGPPAILSAQEGAEDSPAGGGGDVDAHDVGPNDFVVGIAASGTTPYVRGALERAKARGATTALVACSPPPDATLEHVDVAIVAVTGPEVVTGSTRMKAGTATKLVLNMISTGAMIRLGKIYGNLMVDLRATNAKLRDRSVRIVADVCEMTPAEARTLLDAAGQSVKTAIVMHKLSLSRRAAEHALAASNGIIRRLVPGPPPPIE